MEIELTKKAFEFLKMLKKHDGKYFVELATMKGSERQGWKRLLNNLKEKGLIDYEDVGFWSEKIQGYSRIYRIGIRGLKVKDYKVIKETSRKVIIKV